MILSGCDPVVLPAFEKKRFCLRGSLRFGGIALGLTSIRPYDSEDYFWLVVTDLDNLYVAVALSYCGNSTCEY